jgi:hypothetical protein
VPIGFFFYGPSLALLSVNYKVHKKGENMTPSYFRNFIAKAAMVALFAGTAVATLLTSVTVQAGYYDCSYQERRCETHYEQQCGYEQVCRMIPGERSCSQERICKTRTNPPNCQQVEECGTNAQGQPICKVREVCSGGGTVEECGYEQRCYDSGPRQECSSQQVCDNRPVESCNYITVPKTCYEPDPVYPPQPVDPDPVYPSPIYPDPVYPPIDPIPVDPIPVEPTPVDPMPIDPQPPISIGPGSIQKMSVALGSIETLLIFKDTAQSPTFRTRYFISIYDSSGDLVINQFSSESAVYQKIILNQKLSPKQRYRLLLKVQRSGGELLTPVEFTKTLEI